MYQYEWFDPVVYDKEQGVEQFPDFASQINIEDIQSVLVSNWQEHCHECAPPLCYQTCSLYERRKDSKCKNLFYGIYRHPGFSGLMPFGADMRFRKWGKLETAVHDKVYAVSQIRDLDSKYYKLTQTVNFFSDALTFVDKKRKLNGLLNVAHIKYLSAVKDEKKETLDDLVIECYSLEKDAFKLIIEYRAQGSVQQFRESVLLKPGANVYRIPAQKFFLGARPEGRLSVFPENDQECRVVFTWLDFVTYTEGYHKKKSESLKPASKLKCLAFDLDNTLWKGIFIESNTEDLVVNQKAVALLKVLDEKGILLTIVSKNSYEDVWPFLERLGISQYFLYPAINWGQKSENLKRIAELLNINLDTFGVIDDSVFEREEIRNALPQVRVYSDEELDALTGYPELDVPVTEESKNRRAMYQVEQKRAEVAESFSGDYAQFLRSCDINLNLIQHIDAKSAKRCFELIQRTNQLNLSSRRYDQQSFDHLVSDGRYLKIALECYDKFGTYGIVGFCAVDTERDENKIVDFVLSCRVAQKNVEQAFVSWLAEKTKENGKHLITAEYLATARNGQILTTFEALGFKKMNTRSDNALLTLDVAAHLVTNDIITIHEQ